MVKMEKVIMYGIPIVIGGAIVYYLATKPAAPAAAAGAAPQEVMKPGIEGELMSMAMRQLGLPQSEIVIRGLRPQDLGINTFNVAAAGAGWTTLANATVADNTFIAFTGCSYSGTNFAQLRITSGASVREYWPISFIAGLESKLWHDDSPSIAQQNQPVMIEAYAKAAGTEEINIMGVVAEKRGITLG